MRRTGYSRPYSPNGIGSAPATITREPHRPAVMQTKTTALLLALLTFVFAGCRFEINGSSSYTITTTTMVPDRTGPEFAKAFPDPAVLLTTEDITKTRKLLDTVPMPETDAHHDALRDVLAAAESVDSKHLVLLTEAVAINVRLKKSDKRKTGGQIQIHTTNGRTHIYSRMQGEYAPVIDELLLAGAKKLSDIGPESFGRLIVNTQEQKTVVALSDVLLEKSDDESDAALRKILKTIQVASIRHELCATVLLPRGRLNGKRADVAIESMSFDSNRANLIGAIYATRDSIDGETLYRHTKLQSFDSGRTKVVKLGAPKLSTISGATARRIVRLASFDSGKTDLLRILSSRIRLENSLEALDFLKLSSFDSARTANLKILLGGDFPKIRAGELAAFAKTASFDSDRQKILDLVAPHFDGQFTAASAKKLLNSFSFDSGRLSAVRTFSRSLQELSKEARMSILETFSFDSDRKRATMLIMK